jgi:hypothetical protein
LQNLGPFLFQDFVLTGQLVDLALDFVELVGEFANLACGNSQLLLGFSVLIREGLILAIEPADLVSVGAIVITKLAMQVLDFLENLSAFLLEYIVLSGQLVNPLLDFIKFIR